MFRTFNVLDRTQSVQSCYLLEASAGTGKTFSIENIVVRLLIDQSHSCLLENILVVTFTKAATADLKVRIRENLARALSFLRHSNLKDAPDYLIAVLEQGGESLYYAEKQLEQALATFETASIFTIHGFCHRMLKEQLFEADVSISLASKEESLSSAYYYALIRDFFRLKLDASLVTHAQLGIVSKDRDSLEDKLYKLLVKGIEIEELPSASVLFEQFCKGMHALKTETKANSSAILEDFLFQAPHYKNICDRQSVVKRDNLALIERFAVLFDREEWDLVDFNLLVEDGIAFIDMLDPAEAKKSRESIDVSKLRLPNFLEALRQYVDPIIRNARNSSYILCCMARSCQKLTADYLQKMELLDYNDLLKAMHKAVQEEPFVEQIRKRFSVAIIDEFQDTDPIQWSIFNTIFLEAAQASPRLYLVGDPKQSIYGFRQADIYTYLNAGDALGKERRASLDTNFRSTEPLVGALNALFAPQFAPGLMPLPRLKDELPYMPVKSGGKTPVILDKDGLGAVHFFIYSSPSEKKNKLSDAEESYFFLFIAEQIKNLLLQGFTCDRCAILVADRYQASRVANFLKQQQLPVAGQHSAKLTETVAYGAMREFLEAVLSPQRESTIKTALGGPLIGWAHEELLALKDPMLLEQWISKFSFLRNLWLKRGFSALMEAFFDSSWNPTGKTIAQRLICYEDDCSLYHQLQQITELLIEKETAQHLSPYHLLKELNDCSLEEHSHQFELNERYDPHRQGVRILTIHSSKGLEFDIVFALGVIQNSRKPSLIIPVLGEYGMTTLTAANDEADPRYIEYLEELDAEKLRQLYVAFTRAKHRLYIPVFQTGKRERFKPGEASPLDLYLSLISADGTAVKAIQELSKTHSITLATNQTPIENRFLIYDTKPVSLIAPASPIIPGNSRYLHSFTTLSTHQNNTKERPEKYLPERPNAVQKSVHTLPPGPQTGVFLHTMFEKIPFSLAKEGNQSAVLLQAVLQLSKGTPFEEWQDVLVSIFVDTLTMPLDDGTTSFQLCTIDPYRCYREHAFMYGTKHGTEYLKGVIDLIFEHRGKYYIVDWKSNWLGPDASYYTSSVLQEAIEEHQYDLQARIYSDALKRYLQLFDDRSFDQIYGGAYYLFVRGAPTGGCIKL